MGKNPTMRQKIKQKKYPGAPPKNVKCKKANSKRTEKKYPGAPPKKVKCKKAKSEKNQKKNIKHKQNQKWKQWHCNFHFSKNT